MVSHSWVADAGTGAVVADSVTGLDSHAAGAVVVTGSHGGAYPARLVAAIGVRAAVFNDAGLGRDHAGIAGLTWLQTHGVPAAAVGHDTARIGDGADILARGLVSQANPAARALGCEPGMPCRQAVALLAAASRQDRTPGPAPQGEGERQRAGGWGSEGEGERQRAGGWGSEGEGERQRAGGRGSQGRHRLLGGHPQVWALDSASLAEAPDDGSILVTGSHGGLLGGRPETACKAQAAAVVFNDAGIGIDQAGLSRLPVLAGCGIPAATVAHTSARIGDGRSTHADGVLSVVNESAAALGAQPGMSARAFVALIRGAGPDLRARHLSRIASTSHEEDRPWS